MSKTKEHSTEEPKNHDIEKRLERRLEILAYVALGNLTLVVLFTNLSLVLLKKADMLMPFKMLIVTGLGFLIAYSCLGIYYHIREKRSQSPISLCVRILLACVSIYVMIFAVPPSLMLSGGWLTVDIIFDIPAILAFLLGIFAAFVGLLYAFKRM